MAIIAVLSCMTLMAVIAVMALVTKMVVITIRALGTVSKKNLKLMEFSIKLAGWVLDSRCPGFPLKKTKN